MFARQLNTGDGAKPQLLRRRLDGVNTDTARGLIEKNIAAVLNAFHDVQSPVTFMLPAMESVTAEIEHAVTTDMIFGGGDTGFDRRQCYRRFECGTGRIKSAHELVEQRFVIVVGKVVPLLPRQPDIEQIGIKARSRGHGDHIAVVYV